MFTRLRAAFARPWSGGLLLLAFLLPVSSAQAAERAPQAIIVGASGKVEFLSVGSDTWYLASTNLVLYSGDQLRTGERSRAFLRLRDQSILPIKEHSSIRLAEKPDSVLVQLLRGVVSFFHRDEPGTVEIEGGGINAVVRGTEVAFAVHDDGSSTVTVFDGRVTLTDARQRSADLASGDVAQLAPGEAPHRTGAIVFGDWTPVQWALHYPAILDPADLAGTFPPEPALAPAWEAFRRGNLPRALASYPTDRRPASPEESVFLGALLLAHGSVEEAERQFNGVPTGHRTRPLAEAHLRLIELIRRGPGTRVSPGAASAAATESTTPTERLALSYLVQASGHLAEARDLAQTAARQSPEGGLAWARLAELEFCLGRRRPAADALSTALRRVPEHAGTHALDGFVHAAANEMRPAGAAFETALGLDPSLATAWLGRGLARIRRGDLAAGRQDLLTAAALEPQSSFFRSYLAKAFSDSAPFRAPAQPGRARSELELARRLDPADPTPWLYSALLAEQDNRLNEAIDDLERSKQLNDNRYLFRAGAEAAPGGSARTSHGASVGLDQDLAVRSANLARIFADAGFQDIGVREASRAVNLDYADASPHLFLANSYDALRDPRQINLRYETPWSVEYLVGNLLAPVGGGSLSQTVAQNEYSKLFERDRLGIANATTWTGNGDWLQQAAQFGQSGNLAYSLDAYYRSDVGQRLNNDLEEIALTATVHLQASPSDTLLVQAQWADTESGDVLQRYNPADSIPGLRIHERLEPLAYVGWHHEWDPGSHTLFLVSPWNSHQDYVNPEHTVPYNFRDATGAQFPGLGSVPLVEYDSRYAGVSLELQQIWSADNHTIVAGARYQHGAFDTRATLDPSTFDPDVPAESSVTPDVDRIGLYAYDRWHLFDPLLLTVGVAWDRLELPLNFRSAPLTDGSDTIDQIGPKVGLEYEAWKGGTWRAAWTRSLGGVSLDQSVRLEPVQVAGFTQTYRSLVPESVAGSVAGERFETIGVGFDQKFSTRTWLTIAAERLTSEGTTELGTLDYTQTGFQSVVPQREDLDFTEHALTAMVGQLVGRDLAFTVRYRLAEDELDDRMPALAADEPAFANHPRSVLQQLVLGARYQHPRGFFASWESTWTRQTNHDDAERLAGDEYWQHDVWAGWRFWRRRAELAVGVLNLTDEDYRLYPLNYHAETYRERTVAVTGRFAF